MDYKLIAIDIDDTLLTDDLQISPRTRRAIRQAVAKGVYVVLCTGRIRKGAVRCYNELGLDTLMILSGGAEVCDAAGQMVFAAPVDPPLAKKVLQYAYDNGIHAQVYLDGELVYRERNQYSAMYEMSFGHMGVLQGDLLSRQLNTPKVLYVMDVSRADQIQKDAEALFPMLSVKRSKPQYLEFARPDVSKGKALEFVANHYNIRREDIIAVGDSQIDIPMLEFAGLGVAVANASSEVRQAAQVVCPSNEEEGVAVVIEQYILEALHESQAENRGFCARS